MSSSFKLNEYHIKDTSSKSQTAGVMEITATVVGQRELLTQRLRQMESERSIFCLWDTALCPVVLDQQEPPGGRAGYNFLG